MADDIPDEPYKAFAVLVGRCADGLIRELINEGKTEIKARNSVIHCFLDFASGEACRIARREGREPDKEKWTKAVNGAFERAVKRTTVTS